MDISPVFSKSFSPNFAHYPWLVFLNLIKFEQNMIIKITYLTGFEYLIHGSHNLAYFNATTYTQLISNAESQTKDWNQDYAPKTDEEWENYYKYVKSSE